MELPDGSRAGDVAREEGIQLIILDIVMPGREGLESIQRLRREGCPSRILAISGAGQAGWYLRLAALLGADVCLDKSRPIGELLSKVAELTEAPQAGRS